MERFVQFVVGGGIALVAGLWLSRLVPAFGVRWLFGVLIALAGVTGLAQGIWEELDVDA